jgi:polar amino acid transport system substrate-binding protein
VKKALLLPVALSLVMVFAAGCASKSNAPAGAATPPATSATTTDNSWTQIQSKGYFIQGITDTYSPMGFRDAKGTNVGFDVDMGNAVADYLGIKMKPEVIDWDNKFLALNGKEIDCIWCGFSITEDRKKQVTFTDPYISNDQIIVVPVDSKIQTKADLAGKTLSWQLGSSADDAVMKDPIYTKLAGARTYANMPEAFMDMANKRVDAVVLDSIYYYYYATETKTAGKYRVLKENFGPEAMGVGTSLKDTAWSEKLNEALSAVKKSPAGVAISQKWFGTNVFI